MEQSDVAASLPFQATLYYHMLFLLVYIGMGFAIHFHKVLDTSHSSEDEHAADMFVLF